jgi:hypothetical protein
VAPNPERAPRRATTTRQVALVDLLDRVLAHGVVVAGKVTLSIGDVELVDISLQALLSSVRANVSSIDDGKAGHS